MDRPKVLIVDDNEEFVRLVRDIVHRAYPKASVEGATSGSAALKLLLSGNFDVVLLDYGLPDFDGIEVLAEIRKNLLDVAVVVITGEGDESLAVDLFRMGAIDYLSKSSVDSRALRSSIDRALLRRMIQLEDQSDEAVKMSRALEERSRALDIAYEKLRSEKERLRLLSDSLEQIITDRTEELNRTTAFLNEVLASTSDYFIVACSYDGTILSFNMAAESLFGLDAPDVVGQRHFRTLFADLATSGAAEELMKKVQKGECPQLEMAGVVGGSEGFVAKVSFSRLEVEEPTSVDRTGDGFVIIGRDVTHERELEAENRAYIRQVEEANRGLRLSNQKILEANRLKDQFLANVSHELRTPLNAIMGYADLLSGGIYGDLSDRQGGAIGNISLRASDLLSLIEQILDLARLEAGALEVRPEVFSLDELLSEVRDTGGVLGREKSIDVIYNDQQQEPLMMFSDRQKLQQILLNLVNNAVKFSSSGSVEIKRLKLEDGCVELTVQDEGIGIPPDSLESIFDEFRQVDGTSTREYGGSGLGLTISRRFARLLGGDVSVVSTVGSGSTFRVVVSSELRLPSERADQVI
tara:strand:+ start:12048 stop:13790 length:1743 start_codon:yes stop_codon:yes gene_type:complete